MSHAFHEAAPNFDERQILYDGCPECLHRSADPPMFFAHADNATFARAWKRAYDWKASNGGGYAITGDLSHAEVPILNILWGIQVCLERTGVPLDGKLPKGPLPMPIMADEGHWRILHPPEGGELRQWVPGKNQPEPPEED